MGVEAEQPHHKVGGNRQQLHKRPGYNRHRPQHADHAEGDSLRLLHGDPFGHQFAEHQGKVRHNQRNHHDADRLDRAEISAHRRDQPDKPAGERLCQRLRRRRRGEESGQGDADLNRRQKVGGVGGQLEHQFRFLVPLLGHFADLVVVQGDNGDFRRGEKRVDENQHDQQQDLEQ